MNKGKDHYFTLSKEVNNRYISLLNMLYNSNDLRKIVSFYELIPDIDTLILWNKLRPRAKPKIFEVPGDSEITVVIPTANHEGPLAKNIKDVFNGLHIVFVESSGPYFAYSFSSNYGLEYAIRTYRPRWIILSNDDMYKIDDAKKLVDELSTVNERNVATVFTNPPGTYHSYPVYLVMYKKFYGILYSLYIAASCKCSVPNFYDKFGIKYGPGVFVKGDLFDITRSSVALSRINVKKLRRYILTGSFSIFSRPFIEKHGGHVFDEMYLISREDFDLSIRIFSEEKYDFINYRIGDMVGKTLGKGPLRSLKSLVDDVWLNYKVQNGLLKI